MGSLYKRGKWWWIQYYHKGKAVRESTRTTEKGIARARLIAREAESRGHSYNDGKLMFQVLLNDLYDDYLINRRKSMEGLVYKLDSFIRPYFAHLLVTDVTPTVIQTYIRKRLTDGVSNATINRELSYILRAFNLGALNGRIQYVPKIRKLAEAPPRTDSYTDEECATICKHLPDHIQKIVIFANWTGWRRSEILRIRKEHVDLEKNEIWIPPGMSKNNQPRIIAMSPTIHELVKERIESSPDDCPWVFHRNGKQIKNFDNTWNLAIKKSGLIGKTFHGLRRTAAMRFDAKGISTRVIMEMMGHKTRTMFDNYRRVATKEIHEAVKKLEE